MPLPTALPPTVRAATRLDRISGTTAQLKIAEDLGRNGGGGGAGDDAADVTDHIVADRADPLGIAQQADALPRSLDLPGRHGVEGLFVRSGHRHADDIEDDADEDDQQQNEEGHDHGAFAHDIIRDQADGSRDGNGGKENGDDPVAGPAFFLFFRSLRVRFCQNAFS